MLAPGKDENYKIINAMLNKEENKSSKEVKKLTDENKKL